MVSWYHGLHYGRGNGGPGKEIPAKVRYSANGRRIDRIEATSEYTDLIMIWTSSSAACHSGRIGYAMKTYRKVLNISDEIWDYQFAMRNERAPDDCLIILFVTEFELVQYFRSKRSTARHRHWFLLELRAWFTVLVLGNRPQADLRYSVNRNSVSGQLDRYQIPITWLSLSESHPPMSGPPLHCCSPKWQ